MMESGNGISKVESGNSVGFVRADQIDFKSWDARVWSKGQLNKGEEEWEIDLAKLEIKTVLAHGTYGTVYKGAYDAQDVAGLSESNKNLYSC
ncbi:hypothetical protein LIER_07083 [Lithospermum erythrorhizon]|uniref:Uncharacterized protein n=1 Tax=Lithospermum erythrorhizon TaxID=34254 RepID=A0AAV3PB73_LITER